MSRAARRREGRFMESRRIAGLALAVASVGLVAGAQPPSGAPPSWRYERYIQPAAPGPNRLAVDLPLLTGVQPPTVVVRPPSGRGGPSYAAVGGFEDLRLYDANHHEVPYLLVAPPRGEPDWVRGLLLAVAATKRTSGFEADLGAARTIDRLRVEGLPAPFLKRARVEGSGDRAHWTVLAEEVTVFDLPDEQLTRLDVDFSPGDYRYLRLTWDDTNSARLPPPRACVARTAGSRGAAPLLTVSVPFTRTSSEPGVSRYRLRLPGPRLPVVAIDVNVATGNVLRGARVSEGRFNGTEVKPVQLGAATLRRSVRDAVAAAQMRIDFNGPTPESSDLDLVVDDGSNPPLAITSLDAVFAELPWIYFESPGDGPVLARYGAATRTSPRYDLEAARPTLDHVTPAGATWGERLDLAPAAAVPAPAPVTTQGAPLDTSRFRFRRVVADGPPGLTAVTLDAWALAHSELSDLRIGGADGRQVPFILETLDQPLTLPLPAPRLAGQVPDRVRERVGSDRLSLYTIELPVDGLPAGRLALTTRTRVFDRRIRLVLERPLPGAPGDVRVDVLAEMPWRHADPDGSGSSITLPLPTLPVRTLWIVVDEGDNSRLPLDEASIVLPGYRLRFFREASSHLTLWYGDSGSPPPRYDLALLAPRIVGASAHEVTIGPELEIAGSERLLRGGAVFWGALIAAVVVLLAMVVRLLRAPVAPQDGKGEK